MITDFSGSASRRVLEQMGSCLVVSDLNGLIMFFNHAAEEVTGYNAAEVQGKLTLWDLCRDDQAKRVMLEGIRHAVPLLRQEVNLWRRDGQVFTAGLSITPLLADDSQPQGAVAVISDLTQVKRQEEEHRRLDRLAMIGKLASSIAHEIKNPLQAIQSGLDLIAEEETPELKRNEYLAVARQEIERIAEIIHQMRSLYQPGQPLVLQQVSINDVLADLLVLTNKQLALQNILVKQEFTVPLPLVAATDTQLKQLFLNLILNAAEAMTEGGTLQLRTATTLGAGHVPPRRTPPATKRSSVNRTSISRTPKGSEMFHNWVIIQVIDNGVGITKEELPHIFDPFYTTKTRGSGLGLSISQGIVTELGGQITVHSSPREGTTFTISFPSFSHTLS